MAPLSRSVARPIDMSVDDTEAPQDVSQEAPQDTSYTHGPPEGEAGGVLTIDLSAIETNWKRLRSLATPAECGAVVKGDGYGCGLEPVVAQLYHAGCTTFFVADLSEGKRTRAHRAGSDHLYPQRIAARHRSGFRRALSAAGDRIDIRTRRMGHVLYRRMAWRIRPACRYRHEPPRRDRSRRPRPSPLACRRKTTA